MLKSLLCLDWNYKCSYCQNDTLGTSKRNSTLIIEREEYRQKIDKIDENSTKNGSYRC